MTTEKKFTNAVKCALNAVEKNIDAGTLARLRAARRRALEKGLRQSWHARFSGLHPVNGLVTAGVVLGIAGMLWFSVPNNGPTQIGTNEIELLSAPESPDFFADLEIYYWLEASEDASAS